MLKRVTRLVFPNIPLTIMKGGIQPVKGSKNDYTLVTFKVPPWLGKKDIEAVLTKIYNLKVIKINTLNYEGIKKKMQIGGGRWAYKKTFSNYKKAYVTIDEGPNKFNPFKKVETPTEPPPAE